MMEQTMDRLPETPGSDPNLDRAALRELQALTDSQMLELVADAVDHDTLQTIMDDCRDLRQRDDAICAIVSQVLFRAGVSKVLVDLIINDGIRSVLNITNIVGKHNARELAAEAKKVPA